MGTYLEKLLNISSSPLSLSDPIPDLDAFLPNNLNAKDLFSLLERKNGFYAFESALHVFPFSSVGDEIGLIDWNNYNLWINDYQSMADNSLFFAEDIFGGQFCIRENGIYSFDPEVGEFSYVASSIDNWAQVILDDYNIMTGYPLAHSWQLKNGPLATGRRLVPKIPFVVGGTFEVENLFELESVKSMRARANFAIQIRDLPDGASIKFEIID